MFLTGAIGREPRFFFTLRGDCAILKPYEIKALITEAKP